MAAAWYYSERNEQHGPVTFDELRGRAQAGYLSPTDLVWQEGTADWIRASVVEGLFELPTARPLEDGPQPAPRGDYQRPDPRRSEPRPRRAQDYPREPGRGDDFGSRRRTAPAPGMSTGLKVGLIVGGCVLALVVIGVILIVTLSGASRSESFTMELFPGDSRNRTVNVKAGQTVEVDVRTTLRGGFADVDLDIFDPRGNLIAQDTSPDKDCHASFRAMMAGLYRIELRNLGPGGASSRVSVRFY
ncbi:MAG: GYF domain-containing protein [Gemmataceae bacterium]